MRLRIIVGVASCLAAVVAAFGVFSHSQAMWLARHTGYHAIAAATGCFVWSLVRWLAKARLGERFRWKEWRVCAALWGICTVAALASQPFGYRIVEDELQLASTSALMHFEREVAYAVRGYDLGEGFTVVEAQIDKRPMLYPFLVSIVHDLSGYRVENAFAVNAVAYALALAFALMLGRRLGGVWGGRLALFALLSVPLLAQQAMGAGFDVLNVTMILGVALLAWSYLDHPSDEGLAALVLAAVLLAQVRYESGLFLVVIVCLAALTAWGEGRLRLPWLVALAPLLLVHHAWILRSFEKADAWQLLGAEVSQRAFSFEYFAENAGHALNFFLTFDGTNANAPLLFLLGLPAAALFVFLVRNNLTQWWRQSPGWIAFAGIMAGCAIQGFIMLCFRFGQFDDPGTQRLSLPVHLLFAFAIVALLSSLRFPARWLRVGTWVMAICAGFIALPSLSADVFGSGNSAARRARWIDAFVAARAEPRIMGVDNLTTRVWLNRRVPAVTIDSVRLQPDGLARHFALQSFSDIFVSQAFARDPDTGLWKLVPEDDLGAGYALEVVDEFQLTPVKKQRMSRVVSIDTLIPPPPIPLNRPPGPPIWSLDNGKPFLKAWVESLP